jgi:hypothetical protein
MIFFEFFIDVFLRRTGRSTRRRGRRGKKRIFTQRRKGRQVKERGKSFNYKKRERARKSEEEFSRKGAKGAKLKNEERV